MKTNRGFVVVVVAVLVAVAAAAFSCCCCCCVCVCVCVSVVTKGEEYLEQWKTTQADANSMY